jgi:uncharacterized protein (TIGR02145 family)
VGTLQPGTAGGPGAQGPAGPQGPAGGTGPGGEVGCYLQVATAGFDVVCGGAVVGNIGGPGGTAGGGCAIADQAEYYKFTCSPTESYMLAKAWCNYTDNTTTPATPKTKAYDPETMLCNISSGVQGNCNGEGYVVKNRFCSGGKDILARCGAKYIRDELGNETDDPKPDSNGVYNPATQFCLNDALATSAGFVPFFAAATITGTMNIPTGKVTPLCGTPTTANNGKFSKFDFCSSEKIYARCESELKEYNPASQFCQVTTSPVEVEVASQVTNNATTSGGVTGAIKLLCGTASSSNGGRFANTKFCVGTGAAAKTWNKCGTAANTLLPTYPNGEYDPARQYCENTITASGGIPAGQGSCTPDNTLGELTCTAGNKTKVEQGCSDGTTSYAACEDDNNTWASGVCTDKDGTDVTATLDDSDKCTAGNKTKVEQGCSDGITSYAACENDNNTWTAGTPASPSTVSAVGYNIDELKPCASPTNLYDPTTSKCLSSGTIYPICEGKTPISGDITVSTEYDVTKQVCDTRGSGFVQPTIGSTYPTGENGIFAASVLGGKLYSYKAIGNQVWIAQNLDNSRFSSSGTSANPEAVTDVPTGSSGKFTWAQAKLACPEGYSLPTRAQWNALVDASSSTQEPGIVLRATSGGWSTERTPTTLQANGFNAIVFAQTATDGITENTTTTTGLVPDILGKYAFWWATDEDPASATGVGGNLNNAFVRFLRDIDVNVFEGSISKAGLIPVRCIKS